MRLRLLALLLTASAGFLLYQQRPVHAQAPAPPEASSPGFEYVTVEAFDETWFGNTKATSANVCFHTVNGCRWETVRVTVNTWSQINDAYAAALARLGERGWQLTTETTPTPYHRQTATLRRLRVPVRE